ncbi:MAG TPA: PLP-dependent aspartate aminotransferase family protein [Thermoanaerobaculia bacterium]
MSYRSRTLAIHAGQPNDARTGAINVPIYQTSTFEQTAPGVDKGYSYGRTAHPTREALERCIAELEGSEHGLAYASGMAAINGVLATLASGERVVSTRDLYGGAWRIFTKVYRKLGVEFTFVDTTDTAAVADALAGGARLLWLETPSNPLLKITDIRACAALARQAGALTVVDNTFATPILQQPLALGADIVVHSTTKYINGHSDTIGGALVARDKAIHEHLRFFQNAIGAVPGPQDCFLTLRGIKTLPLRVAAHCDSARKIASWLAAHPAVARVYYPGLSTHPGHQVAARQMSDFGAIISVELDADLETTRALTTTLPLWTLAESLGGVKSLLCHPPTMTHASVEPEVRREVGIADGLLRLSVGLEDPDDLIASLEAGLDGILAYRPVARRREVEPCAS